MLRLSNQIFARCNSEVLPDVRATLKDEYEIDEGEGKKIDGELVIQTLRARRERHGR